MACLPFVQEILYLLLSLASLSSPFFSSAIFPGFPYLHLLAGERVNVVDGQPRRNVNESNSTREVWEMPSVFILIEEKILLAVESGQRRIRTAISEIDIGLTDYHGLQLLLISLPAISHVRINLFQWLWECFAVYNATLIDLLPSISYRHSSLPQS